IGDADRVRLGAHLAEGTTVMHEGFVNFNAGTLGASMIEGRISQGVVVGDGSDVGGGASTMGTLSGGGPARARGGRRSLVGAEAGVGIALGDDCVVEAGLYVTAGTKVELVGETGTAPHTVAARELSGVSDLLFRRHSLTGAVQAVAREGQTVELEPALQAKWDGDGDEVAARSRRRARRRGRSAARHLAVPLVMVLLLAGIAGGSYVALQRYGSPAHEGTCVATGLGTSHRYPTDRAANAALISAVAVDRDLPPRAASIALATAYQESRLQNIDYGDRDSVGLFQQRPSQGWGSAEQIQDPVYSTNAFYDVLETVPGYE